MRNQRPKKQVQHKAGSVERLPPESSSINQIAVQTTYSGPIPPAQELAKYNTVVPGAAERILVMAEKNQQHQIEIEMGALNAARRENRRGQFFAFTIASTAFILCGYALHANHPAVAAIIGGTTVVSLVAAFITGARAKP